MKFGVEIPGVDYEVVSLDRKNGNILWQDNIQKEITNSYNAFKILERHGKPTSGYTEITCHLVFEIKLDMTRKSQYVAGGHLTDLPTHMTYSSVFSCETVCIGFLVTAVNELYIVSEDIQNAFL